MKPEAPNRQVDQGTLPSAPSRNPRRLRTAKAVVLLLCLLPGVHLIWSAHADALGANPIESLLHATGDWTLRLLLITLAMTPIRRLTGWSWPIRFRRLLGLSACVYAVLHFGVYVGLDRAFAWSTIIEDIVRRPDITAGCAALLLLVPLALTSTQGWQRRLGRRWKTLHRMVYVIAALGVAHAFWLVKADLLEPMAYGAVLVVLLALRLPWRPQARSSPADV